MAEVGPAPSLAPAHLSEIRFGDLVSVILLGRAMERHGRHPAAQPVADDMDCAGSSAGFLAGCTNARNGVAGAGRIRQPVNGNTHDLAIEGLAGCEHRSGCALQRAEHAAFLESGAGASAAHPGDLAPSDRENRSRGYGLEHGVLPGLWVRGGHRYGPSGQQGAARPRALAPEAREIQRKSYIRV